MIEQTGEWEDAGSGVRFRRVKSDDRLKGIDVEHACEKFAGRPKITWIRFNAPSKYEPDFWLVRSENPLTIEPCIECIACGVRGFIRAGKWIQRC